MISEWIETNLKFHSDMMQMFDKAGKDDYYAFHQGWVDALTSLKLKMKNTGETK